jgi:hypothetical protein
MLKKIGGSNLLTVFPPPSSSSAVNGFLEQAEVPVENSFGVLSGFQVEELRSLFQAFFCQLADSKRYLTSFSILFAIAQFFDLPDFSLLNPS